MSLKVLVDMNLSARWVPFLNGRGWRATSWRSVGSPKSPDEEIVAWAPANDHIVLTLDFDFSAILALTHANGPSVVLIQGTDVLPDRIGPVVDAALRQHEALLKGGALLVLDSKRARVRILPFRSGWAQAIGVARARHPGEADWPVETTTIPRKNRAGLFRFPKAAVAIQSPSSLRARRLELDDWPWSRGHADGAGIKAAL